MGEVTESGDVLVWKLVQMCSWPEEFCWMHFRSSKMREIAVGAMGSLSQF